MILEIANIEIKADQLVAFEQNLEKAQSVIAQAQGYLGHDFQQCIEEPTKYVLLIQWESLEAHTEGFRQSELFREWRALIGKYFAAPPEVLHYELRFQNRKS